MGIRSATALFLAAFCLHAQPDLTGTVTGHSTRTLAIPDFRGAGAAQPLMDVFNRTLWSDILNSGQAALIAKTKYPLFAPQVPGDFQNPPGPEQRPSRNAPAPPTSGNGHWLSDWSGAPVSANLLAFGYAAVQNGVFVLYGNLDNVSGTTLSTAKVFSDRYLADPSDAGARKAAHDYAAAIIKALGGTPILGTHIYFISDRTGHRELWMMDADGSNQRQISHGNFITRDPAVSPDGSKAACAAQTAEGKQSRIQIYSMDPVRQLNFRNSPADYVAQPSFLSDGRIVFASGVDGGYRISIANADGSGEHVVSTTKSVQVQPVVNPQNPSAIAFVSDRGGVPQIYTMSMDGVDASRVTSGVGEAEDPSWHPGGRILAFAWTQGYEPGNYNIFYIEVGKGEPIQLTKASGRNEHPSWAPDGTHIAFQSNRSGSFQIWTTLADGVEQPIQLTTQGHNTSPVWGK
jgi:TolB protein